MNKQKYVSLNIYRYLCSVLIVIIHTRPFADISHEADMIMVDIVGRLAVPFFFMSSGYFLISRLLNGEKNILSYIKNTLRIYLLWSICYYLIDFIQWGHNNIDFYIKKCLFDFVITGSREHLWFMTALIFSIVLTFVFFRTCNQKLLLPISTVLYFIGCLCRAYYAIGIKVPAIQILSDWPGYLTFSRFFFIGFPYFVAGYLIIEIKNKTQNHKNTFFILLYLFSLIVWISETVFLLRMEWAVNLISTFGNYFFTVATILLFFRFPLEKYDKFGSLCRTLSRFTYFSHMFFISLIGHGLMLCFSVQAPRPLKFFFTLVMTFLGGLLIEKTDSKIFKALI